MPISRLNPLHKIKTRLSQQRAPKRCGRQPVTMATLILAASSILLFGTASPALGSVSGPVDFDGECSHESMADSPLGSENPISFGYAREEKIESRDGVNFWRVIVSVSSSETASNGTLHNLTMEALTNAPGTIGIAAESVGYTKPQIRLRTVSNDENQGQYDWTQI